MGATLVLGGTAWLGRLLAHHARERGDEVWCLARGDAGRPPPGVRWIRADRSRPGAYDELDRQTFDRVFEVSWQPTHVAQAVAALGRRAGHWTYISSIAVYAAHHGPHDETAPLRAPMEYDATATSEDYGAAKVACEQLSAKAAGGRALMARAGVLAGPGDPTDRVGYWPGRAALAGKGPMLAPSSSAALTQTLDIRDLVAWLGDAADRLLTGPVNAVGEALSLPDFVALSRRVGNHQGDLVEVTPEWLRSHDIAPWSGPRSLPWWLDGIDRYPAIGRHRAGRFLATGGARRRLADTLADALEDERSRGLRRTRRAGLDRDDELTLIAEANS